MKAELNKPMLAVLLAELLISLPTSAGPPGYKSLQGEGPDGSALSGCQCASAVAMRRFVVPSGRGEGL